MLGSDDYERVLSVKNEVFVYTKINLNTAKGYKAADWGLEDPQFTLRMRTVALNGKVSLKLEDNNGDLFAEAPIDQYPGPCVTSVTDSSRYFVIKVVSPDGKHAFLGIGFADRGDSFDFNVTLQDHFKREKVETKIEETGPALDLGFKEGQTIKINIAAKSGQDAGKPRPKKSPGGGGLLPPPPSGGGLIPKPIKSPTAAPLIAVPAAAPPSAAPQKQSDSDWGDFASFSDSSAAQPAGPWVQF